MDLDDPLRFLLPEEVLGDDDVVEIGKRALPDAFDLGGDFSRGVQKAADRLLGYKFFVEICR